MWPFQRRPTLPPLDAQALEVLRAEVTMLRGRMVALEARHQSIAKDLVEVEESGRIVGEARQQLHHLRRLGDAIAAVAKEILAEPVFK